MARGRRHLTRRSAAWVRPRDTGATRALPGTGALCAGVRAPRPACAGDGLRGLGG
jgi:hypothetical protein